MDAPPLLATEPGRRPALLAGREAAAAGLASLVWLVLGSGYVLGFYGIGGEGPIRPVLVLEAVPLAVALLLPPALFWAVALFAIRARQLGDERERLAASVEDLQAAWALRTAPASADIVSAVMRAAQISGAGDEREDLRQTLARIELHAANRAGEAAALAAEREEIRAALARLEAQARADLAARAEAEAEARRAAAEREEIRRALAELEGRPPGAPGAPAFPGTEREEIRAALRRLEDSADRMVAERAALFAAVEAAQREQEEIRAALARMEIRAANATGEPEGLAAAREELRAALGRLEEGAAALLLERDRLAAGAAEAERERDEIRAALARMEERALDAETLLAEREATIRERGEIREALARMEERAAEWMAAESARQAELIAAATERDEIRAALARMEARAEALPGDPVLAGQDRAEIREALARLEARAAELAEERARSAAEREAARAEREEIRAALARMEERAAAALEARELLVAERDSARAEREEIRAALTRMEERAAAAAGNAELAAAERDVAARERDEIRQTLLRLEARAFGSVEEEREAFAAMLLRLEEQQANSAEALSALLRRREAAEDLARIRRIQAARARAEDAAQPALPFAGAPEAAPGLPADWSEVVRALNFPRDENDREGFRALRRARADRMVAECLQAAEDVLTLLSQDGIYMDDLVPDEVPPELWIAFAEGRRGPEVAGLGAIRDPAALALARGRTRSDPVFRDAALHFLRRFDPVLRRMAEEARELDLHALAGTRTGRAFMLLARVHGAFD